MKSQKYYELYFCENDKKEQLKIFIASILLAFSFHLNLLNLPIKEKKEKLDVKKEKPVLVFLNEVKIKEKIVENKEKIPVPSIKENVSMEIEKNEPFITGMENEITLNNLDFQIPEIDYENLYLPEPPEEPDIIYYIDENIIPPERLTEIRPHYPEAALKAGIEGYVILQIVIDKDGNILNCKVLKEGLFGMTEEAVKEALKQKFKPALNKKTNLPVSCYYTITIRFLLSNKN